MDHSTRRIVQSSWTQVVAESKPASDKFYWKLFELDPALQHLFKGDLDTQKEHLMSMFNVSVRGLDKLDEIRGPLRELGARHRDYGVLPEHYPTMKKALLFMIEETLGEDCSKEILQAWSETYDFMTEAMLEGAQARR